MLGLKTKLLIGAVSFSVIVSLVLWAHVERSGRKAAEIEAEDAQRSIKSLLTTITSERESAERTQALAKSVQEKLDAAETRYDDAIANAMRNGAGLYVAADCPERSDMPQARRSPSEPNATPARIDRATEFDIRRLARDAERAEIMIDGLQKYILDECN